MGEVKVPADKLWGAQTERSRNNFKIGPSASMPLEIVYGFAYLKKADLKQFNSQNGVLQLFGKSKDLWNVGDAQEFVLALERMWKKWPKLA